MQTTKKYYAVTAIALLFALGAAAHAKADVILSSNLSDTNSGTETATGTTYLAASFGTDSSTYSLTTVSLLLANTSAGSAEVDLYTDDGYAPGSLVGTLTSPSTYSTSLTAQSFTSSGITLSADTTYWIVLKALSGSFDWGWTADGTGTGVGYQGQWSEYVDFGTASYWASSSDFPLQMSVSAAAAASDAPEPSALYLLLFATGLLAIGHGLKRGLRPRC
jgi:hypothetical protein